MVAVYLFYLYLLVGFAACRQDRYISYTVNIGEGFNLRRDVHMRVANLVRSLGESTEYKWYLVLPPWPRLYHWQSSVPQDWIQWNTFFDLKSLNEFVQTIEVDEFVKREARTIHEVSQILIPERQNWAGQQLGGTTIDCHTLS